MTSGDRHTNFILIDDSRMDLFLVGKMLSQHIPECNVISFEQPDKALSHFRNTLPETDYTVLLDINMPVISGFEFLDEFAKLPPEVQKHYTIYILTSSQNLTDIERGKSNKYVADVLLKPLNKETLLHLKKSDS